MSPTLFKTNVNEILNKSCNGIGILFKNTIHFTLKLANEEFSITRGSGEECENRICEFELTLTCSRQGMMDHGFWNCIKIMETYWS